MKININRLEGMKILVTGNTGFKGTWLTHILLNAGAIVIGYSLNPPTTPNLYSISGVTEHEHFAQVIGDVRDLQKMKNIFREFKPEIVFHLAAQPIVRDSYRDPVGTYSSNVMGTVHVLECVRQSIPGRELNAGDWSGVKSVLNVTTDKVYKNNEWCWGYRENDPLDGYDPYSNSKSCSELVTSSYKKSFFEDGVIRISTVRAGNVIGGGDFASDRIIPDSVRAMQAAYQNGESAADIIVRNPYSIRPYQHVLEPLFMYLDIAVKQYQDDKYAGSYNVGPDDDDCITTGELVNLFCAKWNEGSGSYPKAVWRCEAEQNAPHEANFLKLDCSNVKSVFNWEPHWHIDQAVEETVNFSKVWLKCEKKGDFGDVKKEMNREIQRYCQ